MTFDEWNEMETNRICKKEPWSIEFHVRVARSGDKARLLFWHDYEEWCVDRGLEPEYYEQVGVTK